MITIVDVLREGQAKGVQLDVGAVETELSKIDQDVIFAKNQEQVEVKLWDKMSSINNVPAETILQRGDIPSDGEVYLIYVKGELVVFQPHTPEEGDVPMDAATAESYGKLQAETFVNNATREEIVSMIIQNLTA